MEIDLRVKGDDLLFRRHVLADVGDVVFGRHVLDDVCDHIHDFLERRLLGHVGIVAREVRSSLWPDSAQALVFGSPLLTPTPFLGAI